MASLNFKGARYDALASESVLDTFLRHGVASPHGCRSGNCQTCLLRSRNGSVPEAACKGIKNTLRVQGYFLACQCRPNGDMDIAPADDADLYLRATVMRKETLSADVVRLSLRPEEDFDYHPGQFLNLRRDDGLVRSYSLASVPHLNPYLQVHVKRMKSGRMSNWIHDHVHRGQVLDVQGPNGECFYVPGDPDQRLLLIGTGTGLAPLLGIARDALASGHMAEIDLYHGSRNSDGLYLLDVLADLARTSANFRYLPCLSGGVAPDGIRPRRADEAAFSDHPDLRGWRVFICGAPPMVNAAKKRAYVSGASLSDIFADPFEVSDLRKTPRDQLGPEERLSLRHPTSDGCDSNVRSTVSSACESKGLLTRG